MAKAITKKAPPWAGFLIGLLGGLMLSFSLGQSISKNHSVSVEGRFLIPMAFSEFKSSYVAKGYPMQVAGSWEGFDSEITASEEDFIVTSFFVAIRISKWQVLVSEDPVIVNRYKNKFNRLKLSGAVVSTSSRLDWANKP